MKKLLLLVLVAGGVAYMRQSLKRAQEGIVTRNAEFRQRGPKVPEIHPPAMASVNADYDKDVQKRIDKLNDDRERNASWEIQYSGKCAAARANMAAIQMAERGTLFVLRRAPNVDLVNTATVALRVENVEFARKTGGADPGAAVAGAVSAGERAAARTEIETFMADHCKP